MSWNYASSFSGLSSIEGTCARKRPYRPRTAFFKSPWGRHVVAVLWSGAKLDCFSFRSINRRLKTAMPADSYIPVIDFDACGLNTEKCSHEDLTSCGKLLIEAFSNVGFAYLKNCGISE